MIFIESRSVIAINIDFEISIAGNQSYFCASNFCFRWTSAYRRGGFGMLAHHIGSQRGLGQIPQLRSKRCFHYKSSF